MRHSRSHFLLAAALLGLAHASSVAAQDTGRPRPRDPMTGAAGRGAEMRRGGPQSGPDQARRGPREGRGNPAAMLLRLRTRLSLTDDQVTRLEALAATGAPKANASDMLRARADLMDAMQGDGNLNSARTALDKMSRLRNDRLLAGLKLRQEARAILTADQKRTLDNMQQDRRGRGGRGNRAMRGRRGPQGERGLPPDAGFRPDGAGRPGLPGARRGESPEG